MLPTWTDICSCNICIHHIPVDYVGKEREQGAEAFPAFDYSEMPETPTLAAAGRAYSGLHPSVYQSELCGVETIRFIFEPFVGK